MWEANSANDCMRLQTIIDSLYELFGCNMQTFHHIAIWNSFTQLYATKQVASLYYAHGSQILCK